MNIVLKNNTTNSPNYLIWDADALSFISTVGITRETEKIAINYLVTSLKKYGLWSKHYCIYPFLGDTSVTQKYNLINTATYPISWVSTPTHSRLGVKFNGANYGATGFVPSTVFTIHDCAVGVYCKSDLNNNTVAIGSVNSATQQFSVQLRNAGGAVGRIYSSTNQLYNTVSDSLGFTLITKQDISNLKLFKYGAQVGATQTLCVGTQPTWALFIGAVSSAGVAASWSTGLFSAYTLSSGLTDYESIMMTNIIETYQRLLGRGLGQGYNITYEGDSFMSGATALATKMNTFLDNRNYSYRSTNLAVSGSGIGYIVPANNYMQFATRYNAVTSNYNGALEKNVLLAHEGINELNYYLDLGGLSAADAATSSYNNYETYYGALVGHASAGYKCIFNTTTPRSDAGMDPDYELARQNAADKYDATTLNGKLRNDFTTATAHARIFSSNLAKWTGCLLVDIGDDPTMGQAGQSTNLTYYQADGIHPTDTGGEYLVNNYYGKAMDLIYQGVA